MRLWDATSDQLLATLRGRVQAVAWSPNGRRLACASEDKTVRLWKVEEGKGAVFECELVCFMIPV